jgi:hypothetical protein
LENVIKGKGGSPPLVESLKRHVEREELVSSTKTWVCPKVKP